MGTNVVEKDFMSGLVYNPTAQSIWENLRYIFIKVDVIRGFQLHRDIYIDLKGTITIIRYFGRMRNICD